MKSECDFVAIDFETANSRRVNACAVGISIVHGADIVTRSFLIRPPEMYFDPWNISIHGITPEMVEGAPTFRQLYPEIREFLSVPGIWAHYAPFDQGVLNALGRYYRLPVPRTLQCTCRLSRTCFPRLRSHSLSAVCRYLRIPLKHHDAASDAEACARIVLATRAPQPPRQEDPAAGGEPLPELPAAGELPISGRTFCLTGDFVFGPREAVQETILNLGGTVKSGVSRKVDYLLVGELFNPLGAKWERTLRLAREGHHIRIVREARWAEAVRQTTARRR